MPTIREVIEKAVLQIHLKEPGMLKAEDWVDVEPLSQALNLYFPPSIDHSKFNERVKEYRVVSWRCTDTIVGVSFYTLYDKPVAWSVQSARRSEREISFFCADDATTLRNFILSLDLHDPVKIVDMNEEVYMFPNHKGYPQYKVEGYVLEIKA